MTNKYPKFLINFLAIFLINFSVAAKSHNGTNEYSNLIIGINESEIIVSSKDITRIFINDTKVANIIKHDKKRFSIIGKKLGKTTLKFMHGGNVALHVNLTVTHDLTVIKESLKMLLPDEDVGLQLVNNAIAITGSVSSNDVATKAIRIVEEYTGQSKDSDLKKIINLLKVNSSQQVMLRVRVGEINRIALDNLGLGVRGILTSGASILGALEKERLFKVMAEPSLTAISGEKAEFLAGGEFPIPVPKVGGGTNIEFKPFGVNLGFTPNVLSKNRIRLNISSEVSEIKNVNLSSNGTFNSMKIPSISTRRANTTVELAPGESFMIAGLVKNNSFAKNVGDFPALGDIPVLGALFRSTGFIRNETELVMSVTPYLVNPVKGNDIRLPTDTNIRPSMLDTLFYGKLEKETGTNILNGLEGSVGYQLD